MVEAEAKLKGKEVEKKDNAGGKGTPRGKGKGKKGEPVEEVDLVKKREELREAKRLDKQVSLHRIIFLWICYIVTYFCLIFHDLISPQVIRSEYFGVIIHKTGEDLEKPALFNNKNNYYY